jgi:DNA-binding NarL/FixJ family response regulator
MTLLQLLVPAISAVLAAAAVAVSLFAVWKARALAVAIDSRAGARCEELQETVACLQKALDGQAASLAGLEQQQSIAAVPNLPRAGMNVSKRSQVLRLHRKGDAPERIAAALELPIQEVDLLIKVHRVVLSNL